MPEYTGFAQEMGSVCFQALRFAACTLVLTALGKNCPETEAREIPAGKRQLWGAWMPFPERGRLSPFGTFEKGMQRWFCWGPLEGQRGAPGSPGAPFKTIKLLMGGARAWDLVIKASGP